MTAAVSDESGSTQGSGRRRRPDAGGYTADSLAVLEGLDAVRKRPGMYIGSTDSRGLMHCLWEILDNSVDEALAGHCGKIEVQLRSDGSVEVRDDGRGIPVDTQRKARMSGVEVVMTKLHAGGKFGGGSYAASGGLHGVGASVVNALSARLDVAVDRDGRTHEISFRRGVPGLFDGDGPEAPFRKKTGLRTAGRVPPKRTGTRVRWWFDPTVFPADSEYDIEAVLRRVQQSAFLVPGLQVRVIDERAGFPPLDETVVHAGGITDYVEALSQGQPVTGVIRLTGSGRFTETVPVLDDAGHMETRELEREMGVDVAMRWTTDYDSDIRSFVNIIATTKGGTHLSGFERALTKTINARLRESKVLKASEDAVTKDDITEGLTAVVTVRIAEPQFESQTKEILGTPAASRIVASVVNKRLGEWFDKPPRGEKANAKAALEKVAAAMRARVSARQTRDLQRRKTALENSALPAKLVDCRSRDVEHSELFIVEGDSALGTAKMARDSQYQALLPIRGKILNVQRASMADMLKNTECSAIIQVIGAGSGRTFDLDLTRYGKIIMMSDADVDGAHIRCLLLTLFHRYMRPLLEEGRVYAAVPPLHRIEVTGRGRQKSEVIYTYSDAEMAAVTRELRAKGRTIKDPVQRYKGLGEMDAKQLRETTMAPGSRKLRRMQVADAAEVADAFHLLMGTEVAPRKQFLVEGAVHLDRARIDV